MSLGSRTPGSMDLAAFKVDEVEPDRRHGVFRHRRSLRAVLARALPKPAEPAATTLAAEPDHFVWHSVEDLLRAAQTPDGDR